MFRVRILRASKKNSVDPSTEGLVMTVLRLASCSRKLALSFFAILGDDLKESIGFQEPTYCGKEDSFRDLCDVHDFEMKFRRCITTYIRNLRAAEMAGVSGQSQAPTSKGDKQQTVAANDRHSTRRFPSKVPSFFVSSYQRPSVIVKRILLRVWKSHDFGCLLQSSETPKMINILLVPMMQI